MVDVSPSGEIGETFQVHLIADRRNLGRWMKYLHPEESLQILIVVLVASVLHRPTKFLRSATCTPGTFLWFRQTATCPPLQAISSMPLDPSWWWWRLAVLVRAAHSAQAEGWDLFLSPNFGASPQSPRPVSHGGIISSSSKEMFVDPLV